MMNNGWIRVRRPFAAMTLLVALGSGAAMGAWLGGRRDAPAVTVLCSGSGGGAPAGDQLTFGTGLAPVVERVLPSVVNVASEKIVRFADSGPASPFFGSSPESDNLLESGWSRP